MHMKNKTSQLCTPTMGKEMRFCHLADFTIKWQQNKKELTFYLHSILSKLFIVKFVSRLNQLTPCTGGGGVRRRR